MGERQRSWEHSFACAWHDGEPCTCKDAGTDPGLPLTTGEGSGFDKTPAELLAEMRAFALTLPDDLGPLFGRDVARMCDECGRLREQLDAARADLKRAAYLAEHLWQMIDPETWRATGGDDGQGHYEGDYRAEQTRAEIQELAARAALGVERCGNCGVPGDKWVEIACFDGHHHRLTEPGSPLTTGEGNTASHAVQWLMMMHDDARPKSTTKLRSGQVLAELKAALADRDRLREQLDAARQALDALATSLEQKVAGNKQGPDMGWTHPDEPADQLRREVGYVIEDARAALGGCPLSDRPLTTREGAAEARARAEAWLAGLVRRDMTASIATATDLARDVVALTDELLEGG